MHEVLKVPAGHDARPLGADLLGVVGAEELHPHDGEDEDDDAEDKGQVTKSTDSFPHDGDEKVEGWPGLGKFKYSQLE